MISTKEALKLIHARLVSIRAFCDDPAFTIPNRIDESMFFMDFDRMLDILGDALEDVGGKPVHHAEMVVDDGAADYALPSVIHECIFKTPVTNERYGYGKPNC